MLLCMKSYFLVLLGDGYFFFLPNYTTINYVRNIYRKAIRRINGNHMYMHEISTGASNKPINTTATTSIIIIIILILIIITNWN